MTADGMQFNPANPALDEPAFRRLLTRAGPEAPELMRRLRADLRDVAEGLTAGFANADRLALRKHSHVLLAIAGTIGAQPIHRLALDLNLRSKDDTCVFAASDAADLLHRLTVLQDRLREMSAERDAER